MLTLVDLLGGIGATGVDGGVINDGDPGVGGWATGCGIIGVGVYGMTTGGGSGSLTTGSWSLTTGVGL